MVWMAMAGVALLTVVVVCDAFCLCLWLSMMADVALGTGARPLPAASLFFGTRAMHSFQVYKYIYGWQTQTPALLGVVF